jgi:hypothetical protein
MKLNRIRAIAWKELLQIRRDLRSIMIVFAMPVVLMFMFGYGVSFDIKHLPVYVFDRENSQQSRDLVQLFRASEYFQVVRSVDNYRPVPAWHRHSAALLAASARGRTGLRAGHPGWHGRQQRQRRHGLRRCCRHDILAADSA